MATMVVNGQNGSTISRQLETILRESMSGIDLKPQDPQIFDVPVEIPWTELNQRYFIFAASLPSPLDKLALDRQLFTGKGEAVEFCSLAELHPLLTCLPWLFDEAFPAVSRADVLDIAEAGIFLFMGMLLYDAYRDNQLTDLPDILILHQQLTVTALHKFHMLFEDQAPFWPYLDKYFDEYNQALLLEKEHCGQIKDYPLELMYKIGSGKVALFKSVTTALALKGQAEKHVIAIETAVDLLTAAMQLGDDIGDWAEDYQCRNYTLPLTHVIPVEYWPAPDLSAGDIGARFESSVVLERLIIQVTEWFQLALNVIDELTCPHWVAFVESCLALTRNYHESIVTRKLLQVLSPSLSIQTNA